MEDRRGQKRKRGNSSDDEQEVDFGEWLVDGVMGIDEETEQQEVEECHDKRKEKETEKEEILPVNPDKVVPVHLPGKILGRQTNSVYWEGLDGPMKESRGESDPFWGFRSLRFR